MLLNAINTPEGATVRDIEAHNTHALRTPLEHAIAAALGPDATPEQITEAVMVALGEQRVIDYRPQGLPAFLTTQGRIMVVLAEHPTITMRELAVTLGASEGTIARLLATLSEANYIARTKTDNRNTYKIVPDVTWNHPDIRRYHDAISKIPRPNTTRVDTED